MKKPGLDSGRAFLLHGSRTMTVSRGHQRAACVHALHAQPAEAKGRLSAPWRTAEDKVEPTPDSIRGHRVTRNARQHVCRSLHEPFRSGPQQK
jgi:hypothetical protein